MKAKKCTLIVNARNGHCFQPEECSSIAEAVRKAKEDCGFAYRIFVDGVCVKRGFCD